MYGKIISQMNEVIEKMAIRATEEEAADLKDAELMLDAGEIHAHWACESVMKNHADRQWRGYVG